MALGALSLSTTQGVRRRPFQATINGLTTGNVRILDQSLPAFSIVNGKLRSERLPDGPVATVTIREYEPGVGAGYRDTTLDIAVATQDALLAQATSLIGGGRSLRSWRDDYTALANGEFAYRVLANDDLGAMLAASAGGGTPTPTPTPGVPNALAAPTALDDFTNGTSPAELNNRLAGASGQWTTNSNGLWQTYTESNSLGSIIRQVNFSAAGPAKLNNLADLVNGWGSEFSYEVDWTSEFTTDPTYSADATDANRPNPVSWTFYNTDTNNYLFVQIDTVFNRITVTPRVGGTTQTSKSWSVVDTRIAKDARLNLKFEVRDARVWLAINGVWLDRWASTAGITAQPRNYADLRADFPSNLRKGVITFENALRRNPRAMGVAVRLGAKLTIADDNGYTPVRSTAVANAGGTLTDQTFTFTFEGPEPPVFYGVVRVQSTGGVSNATTGEGLIKIYTPIILTRDRFGGTATIAWKCPPNSTLNADTTPAAEGDHYFQVFWNAMPAFYSTEKITDTHAEVTLAGTYDGTPTAWFVTILDGDRNMIMTGDPAFTTQQVTPTKAANGQYEIKLMVPVSKASRVAAISYNEGSVRHIAYSRRFKCGDQHSIEGQSNALGRGSGAWVGTYDPTSAAVSYVNPIAPAHIATNQYLDLQSRPTDTFDRSALYEMARIIQKGLDDAGLDRAVSVVNSGHGGSPLKTFIPGYVNEGNWLEQYARTTAQGRKACSVLLDQGEAEASGLPVENADYAQTMLNFVAHRKTYYNNSSLKIGIAALGKYGLIPNSGPNPTQNPRGYARQRAMQFHLPNLHPDIFVASWRGGEARSDNQHFTGDGHTEDCQRCGFSILKNVYGINVTDGLGPKITGATLVSSGVVDLTVDLRGYDSITGTAITGYIYSNDGGSTWLDPSSVEIVAGKIRISGTGLTTGSIIRGNDNHYWDETSMAKGVKGDGRRDTPVQPIVGTWTGTPGSMTFTDAGLVVA